MNPSAALLMQAGFASRLAAIKTVQDTQAQFTSAAQLRQWLNSEAVIALTQTGDWPTPETARMWSAFWSTFTPRETSTWNERAYFVPVDWNGDFGSPPSGQAVRISNDPESGEALVLSANATRLGRLEGDHVLNPGRAGLIISSVLADRSGIEIRYIGPDDLWLN